jgi:hypothetical protein
VLDLRGDPVVTLETLMLSAEIERTRTGAWPVEAVLTLDQMRDVYGEMQNQVRFADDCGDAKWRGLTLRCEEPA